MVCFDGYFSYGQYVIVENECYKNLDFYIGFFCIDYFEVVLLVLFGLSFYFNGNFCYFILF